MARKIGTHNCIINYRAIIESALKTFNVTSLPNLPTNFITANTPFCELFDRLHGWFCKDWPAGKGPSFTPIGFVPDHSQIFIKS